MERNNTLFGYTDKNAQVESSWRSMGDGFPSGHLRNCIDSTCVDWDWDSNSGWAFHEKQKTEEENASGKSNVLVEEKDGKMSLEDNSEALQATLKHIKEKGCVVKWVQLRTKSIVSVKNIVPEQS